MEPDLPTSTASRSGRRSILFIGGCQVEGLIHVLRADFDCRLLWRRPTIPLMSRPLTIHAPLDFENRQSRYIVRDCAKSHLSEIRSTACDVLVFEIMRDVRIPLVRSGDAYIFDPNGMFDLVPDAPPAHERSIDLASLLGDDGVRRLDAFDPDFLPIWERSFRAFHDTVLAPIVDRGGLVVLQRCFLAKQTLPPSEALRAYWDYCDAANALLGRMYAIVEGYPGIRTIGLEEDLCVTGFDAAWGGIAITHFIPDVFALMADQLRAVIDPGDARLGEATRAQLIKRASDYYRVTADEGADRHALKVEILKLQQLLDYERASRDWERRRRPIHRLRRLCRKLLRRHATPTGRAPTNVGDGRADEAVVSPRAVE